MAGAITINYNQIRNPQLKKWVEEEFHDELFDVTTGHDHDGVNSPSLSPGANIEDGAVTAGKIASDAVITVKILDANVTAEKLATDSVTTDKIENANVTTAKINDDAVTTAKIAAGAVDTTELAADAVTGAKIDDNAVNSEHITAGAIDRAHLEADIIDSTKLADNAVDSDHIVAGAIDHAHLAAACVEGDNIDDEAINSDHYVDGSIDTAHIGNDQVDNDKLANITRGSVKVGGEDNAPTDLAALTAGQILVGDGTDIKSVAVSGDATLAATGALTLAADSVENSMLANITQGSIKVGGAASAPTDLNAKTDKYILIGDGTDINSVAVSGDVEISNTGATTIGAGKVLKTMMEDLTQGSILVGGALDAVTALDASTTTQILVGDGTDLNSVALSGDVTMANDGEVTIADEAVTTTKMADLAQGSILAGGASNHVGAVDASGDGQILVGDGTDIASVAVSGDIAIDNTGDVTIAASAVETGMIADDNVTSAKIDPEYMKVAVAALVAGNSNAFCLNWQNPEAVAIIVNRIIVDVTTAGGTGGGLLDFGTATSDDITGNNLIDGADANAVALYDNVDDQGTDGKSKQKLDAKNGTTDWITGQILTQNAAALDGYVYIYYTAVPSV